MATTGAPQTREAAVQVVVRLRPLAGESSENFTVNVAEKVGNALRLTSKESLDSTRSAVSYHRLSRFAIQGAPIVLLLTMLPKALHS